MYVEFVDLFLDVLGLNTKAKKTVNVIFECCVYLKKGHIISYGFQNPCESSLSESFTDFILVNTKR